jgi:hypothetical protein
MKYQVATIASVIVGALLIVATCVQTRYTNQKTLALRANLSALSIDQLTARFWECQPHSPGESYKRDAPYCAEVNNIMTTRASEVVPLQVVSIQSEPPELMDLPLQQLLQRSVPSLKRRITIPAPPTPVELPTEPPVFPSTAAG